MKGKINKIVYIATSVMLITAVILCNFTVPVEASEIESLPAVDVDIEVSYDSNNIFLNHNDNVYQIPFSYDIRLRDSDGKAYDRWVASYMSDASYYYYTNTWSSHAKYTDSDAYGNICPFSFWFSPSENKIYTVTGMDDLGKVVSFYDGTFHFDKVDLYRYIAFNCWDLGDMSFERIGLVSHHRSENYVAGVPVYMRLDSNYNFSSFYDVNGYYRNFPADLVCIYSNYEISGFYEFSNNTVFTPDYYFRYQYLFYVEGVGYTFIDSALPVTEIVDNSSSYALVYFEDYCNSHIYTSSDGVSWTKITSASTMYSFYTQLSYKWFFENVGGSFVAKLIYSNDDGYGKGALITPEFMESFVSDEKYSVSQIIYYLDYYLELPKEDLPNPEEDWFATLVYMTQSFRGDVVNFYRYYKSLQDDSLIKEFNDFIEQQTILKSFTEEFVYEYVFNDDGTYTPVMKTSIYGLLKMCVKSMVNIDTDLGDLQMNLHNDLKSVFDNISLSNFYLESINTVLGDMPNYTKKLDQILLALENLELSAPAGSGGVVDLSSLEQYLIAIDDTTEIQTLLQELDKSIDNIAQIEAVDELTDFFQFVDGEGDEVETKLSDLFKGVLDPENQSLIDDVGGFISSAVTSVTYGGLLSAAFENLSQSSDGIGWINSKVEGMYAVSGNLQPIFLIGVSMLCVNLIVRRNG